MVPVRQGVVGRQSRHRSRFRVQARAASSEPSFCRERFPMSRSAWVPRWGDINGLFGLLLDNVAALVLLYMLLAAPGYRADRFSASFVLAWLIPGTVAGVLFGGVFYAVLAGRLARRTGRQDVTAMPVGLDTPSV